MSLLSSKLAMKKYNIYRGIDNEIEFKGLKGQYFYYAAGGAGCSVFLSLIFHMIGLPIIVSLVFLLIGFSASYFVTTHFNKSHGKWGFNKLPVISLQPRYVVRRKSIRNIVKVRTVKKI